MSEIRIAEWLLILAALFGPVLAVQAQKWIERVRETRQRKLRLFYTLMATRSTRVSPDHVQALNMIDIEFYGTKILWSRFQNRKERGVVESWKIYHDHLNEPNVGQDAIRLWVVRGDQLFGDLLFKMAVALGYEFDAVQLKRGIYHPRAHDEQEIALIKIRDNLAKILSGEKSLPMAVTELPVTPEDAKRHRAFQDAVVDALSGKRPIKVTTDNPDKDKG